MIELNIPYQDVLFTTLNVIFMAWPLLLISPLQRRKGILPGMVIMWIVLAIVRIILAFNPRPSLILIPEPLNTTLFLSAGAVLFVVLILASLTRRRRA